MKAYNLAMIIIFINIAGVVLVASNAFPGLLGPDEETSSFLLNVGTEGLEIAGIEINIITIAVVLMAATAVLLGSRGPSASGIAIMMFATIYWGSLIMCMDVISAIPIPDMGMYVSIFLTIAAFIFIATLLQMPTGGMKTYD